MDSSYKVGVGSFSGEIEYTSISSSAIARIDRMSQLQETEVYCYYAEGAALLAIFYPSSAYPSPNKKTP